MGGVIDKKAVGGVDTVEKGGSKRKEEKGRETSKRVIMLHISEIMKFAF